MLLKEVRDIFLKMLVNILQEVRDMLFFKYAFQRDQRYILKMLVEPLQEIGVMLLKVPVKEVGDHTFKDAPQEVGDNLCFKIPFPGVRF